MGLAAGPAPGQDCGPRDFLGTPLPAGTPGQTWTTALSMAYPQLRLAETPGAGIAISDGAATINARGPTGRSTPEIIASATVGDQFAVTYPLSRSLDDRLIPFFDPGRARNDAFFQLLYGPEAGAVEPQLVTVTAGPARFRVTARHGVACQLAAAFGDLDLSDPAIAPLLDEVGGGYLWRRIAGTDRLSPHSYGIAIDLNAALGGYWRWTGADEGEVGGFDNNLPWALVESLERRGFIWGGKWHHFDGMHFEYRPELILYSRMSRRVGQ
ncbi:hypothetical protein GCM10011324_03200 [Allosediminivita pacifica]|uniref:D-alanyl-D-alanine carboxypeptidase-like protein n=2 Tax=Allosediminivita pacifica TaxID=1267769 RepID=A0A2T6B9J6_9RHOB|nr:D-alanyl-D-alanine carboxypeptidase-like protein [Allosediminivita pacifica]GGA96268.1 hypothetical protein GCM10011324_03200 [Allosediminivita pacifica]